MKIDFDKFKLNKPRFILRDIKTKETYKRNNKELIFRTIAAAGDFKNSMKFNLGFYYEIYDLEENMVVGYSRNGNKS